MPSVAALREESLHHVDVLPLYYKVYYLLRQELLNRIHATDTPLQSEVNLAARFGVSRVTVRRALERLEEEGLIVRKRGRHGGTFPVEQPHLPQTTASITGLLTQIPWKKQSQSAFLNIVDRQLPADLPKSLKVAQTRASFLVVRRLLSVSDKPAVLVEEYVPKKYRPLLKDLETTSNARVLWVFSEHGLLPASADQVISTCRMSKSAAKLLDCEPGDVGVRITIVVRDQFDELLEVNDAIFRADKFEHQMTLVPMVREGL